MIYFGSKTGLSVINYMGNITSTGPGTLRGSSESLKEGQQIAGPEKCNIKRHAWRRVFVEHMELI